MSWIDDTVKNDRVDEQSQYSPNRGYANTRGGQPYNNDGY